MPPKRREPVDRAAALRRVAERAFAFLKTAEEIAWDIDDTDTAGELFEACAAVERALQRIAEGQEQE